MLAGLVLVADLVVLAFVVPAVANLGRIPKYARPDPKELGLPALLVPAQTATLFLGLAVPVLLVLSCLPGRFLGRFLGRAVTRRERALGDADRLATRPPDDAERARRLRERDQEPARLLGIAARMRARKEITFPDLLVRLDREVVRPLERLRFPGIVLPDDDAETPPPPTPSPVRSDREEVAALLPADRVVTGTLVNEDGPSYAVLGEEVVSVGETIDADRRLRLVEVRRDRLVVRLRTARGEGDPVVLTIGADRRLHVAP